MGKNYLNMNRDPQRHWDLVYTIVLLSHTQGRRQYQRRSQALEQEQNCLLHSSSCKNESTKKKNFLIRKLLSVFLYVALVFACGGMQQ